VSVAPIQPTTISGPCRLCGRSDPRVVRTADLVIDLDARRVWRAGVEAHLTPHQFDVLAVLSERQGAAVHQHQIWRRVWPDWAWEPTVRGIYGGSPHTIRVRVLRLRAALGDRSGQLLQTVQGYGYRLRANEEREGT